MAVDIKVLSDVSTRAAVAVDEKEVRSHNPLKFPGTFVKGDVLDIVVYKNGVAIEKYQVPISKDAPEKHELKCNALLRFTDDAVADVVEIVVEPKA